MSETQFPLKDHLIDPVDEAAIHRIGEQIDLRLRRPRPRRLLPLALVGATAVAAVIVAAGRIHRDAGPLLFADGRELVAMDAGSTAGEIALSDGSHIRLSPGAHIEPLESSGTTFSAIVTQGHADFEVRPGGPRHWVIECGLATVEVTGTSFSCDREPGRLRLVVRHGAVLVRGERVPDRARRLLAGESLELAEDSRSLRCQSPLACLARLPQCHWQTRRRAKKGGLAGAWPRLAAGGISPGVAATGRPFRLWASRDCGANRSTWA